MGRPTGVVLAGGRSRRMGADKRFLLAGGVPLIDRSLAVLRERCGEVLISANDPERFEGRGHRVVPDRFEDAGPIAGIHAGLAAASEDLVLFLPVDAPFVSRPLLDALEREAWGGFDLACGSSPAGIEPLVGYYRRRCLPAIEARAGEGRFKVTDFFPLVRARVLTAEETAAADPSGRTYANLNTPGDLDLLAPAPRGEGPGDPR